MNDASPAAVTFVKTNASLVTASTQCCSLMHHEDRHPDVKFGKIGILLINLGSPDAASFWPVRRYLKEFLSDPRVINARGLVWWLVFNGIILNRRPVSLGRAYNKIWNRQTDEAPLKTTTRKQSEKLTRRFAHSSEIEVDWAMRYAAPPISAAVERLKQKGCDRILLFPLYPQYSAATTASALDKAFDALQSMRWQPAIRTAAPYYAHPAYIAALAASLEEHLETLEWQPQMILASFHGLPEEFINKGDPYLHHCQETTRLLRTALGCGEGGLLMTFQSSTRRGKWLGPSTENTVRKLAEQGVRNLLVITPGFAADCLETLEEISLRAQEVFCRCGGKSFSMVPCLNDTSVSIDMLAKISSEELAGWT